MKLLLLLLCALPISMANAQAITSLYPAANALAIPRAANVVVTLAGAPGLGAKLRVFSSVARGQLAGTLTRTSTSISFNPDTDFKAGETLWATFTTATGTARVWQFTAATTGGGTFGGGSDLYFTAYPYGQTLLSIAVGDLTGDGNLDVLAREIGTNLSPLFAGDGMGQLSPYTYALAATYNWRMLPPLGDIDGDGLLNLVPGLNIGGGTISYALNPNYIPRSEYDGIVADLDGDGDLDYAYTYSSQLAVATNTGTGALALGIAPVPLAADGYLSPGDLDGDGDVDLVHFSMAGSGSIAILLNNGQGIFTLSTTYPVHVSTPFYRNHMVAVGDLDGDGDLDLAVPLQTHRTAASTDVWLNNGQAAFTAPAYAAAPTSGIASSYTICLGDVDGDGDLDALTNAPAQLFLNNGSGVFAPGNTLAGLNAYSSMALADMNNDGALDVVAAQPGSTPGGPGTGQPGRLSIRLSGTPLAATSRAALGYAPPWPNPLVAGSLLHIAGMGGATATLYTLTGQQIRQVNVGNSAGGLPTAGLASGLYLLRVQPTGQAPLTYRVTVE